MPFKNIITTVLLISILIITSLLAIKSTKKITATDVAHNNNPDFFILQATYTKFNDEGILSSQIYADKITHFDLNNVFWFEHPTITINNSPHQPWKITAKHGKSEGGKAKVYLWNNVTISRELSNLDPKLNITTPSLEFYPETNLANTKEAITIMENSNTIKALGATADFKTGIIKLLSKIESWYKIE